MAQKTKSQAKEPRTKKAPKRRVERRFATSLTYVAPWVGAVGMLGALVLGAGVFGLWIKDPPIGYASYLVALGGLGLGVALWFAQPSITAVCVGDAGLALESGKDIDRLAWCDMESLRVAGDKLVAKGGATTLAFSLKTHAQAAAWALKEAATRLPSVLDVPQSVTEKLPAPSPTAGTEREILDAQVAGHRCAASKKIISFEDDARLCPRCGQVYHKDHVPSTCATCEESLTSRTLRA
jgi:hypothetical protein